jgi:hypothetical protein
MSMPGKLRRSLGSQSHLGRSKMARRRIIVFGDSHVHALQEAVRHRAAKGRKTHIEIRRLLKVKGNKSIGDTSFDEILEIARSLSPDDILVTVIGGNQHAVFSTIQHPEAFDFLIVGDDSNEFAGDTEIIPFRTLADYFASGIRNGDAHSIQALRKATVAKVFQLIAPPPKSENSFIEDYHDTRFAEEGIGDLGVSSPKLRMKFWRLQNHVIERFCKDMGVEIIPPPTAAREEDGFLARGCYAKDATHANENYGELVLEQLERLVPEDKTMVESHQL